MGITSYTAKWLWIIKNKYGVDFSELAVLGRQSFPLESEKRMRKHLKGIFDVDNLFQEDGYSEKLWQELGCKHEKPDVFDYSGYEGANCIHDMNIRITENYVERYSAVVDGGSIEHIFDFQTAIRNLMLMVCWGGHLILMTPANQYMGHGYYQYSPQLFFDLLKKDNGFEIEEMILFENKGTKPKSIRRLYDNTACRTRIIKTSGRASIFVVAKRVGDVPDAFSIQQSDYKILWSEATLKTNSSNSGSTQRGFRKSRLWLQAKRTILFRILFWIKDCVYTRAGIYYNGLMSPYDLDKEIKRIKARYRNSGLE